MTTVESQAATATYFDGHIDRRRAVRLELGPALDILEDGVFLAAWAYADVRRTGPRDGVLRLRALTAPKGAWLEIDDPALAASVAEHCRLLDGERAPDPSAARKRLGWGLLAATLFGAFLWGGVPRAAGLIAPVIPDSWEKKLGEVADEHVRKTYSGKSCTAPNGVAALKKLSASLQAAAHLRIPADLETVGSKIPNAFALPGGKVYLLSGLLNKARSQDEILGVLAHELGHVQNRDHLRRVIATGGTAILVSMVFGDITGGGAMVVIGNSLLNAAHSRATEAQADDFAALTLTRLGRPARPMGELLLRVTGAEKDGAFTILHDHPMSEDRLAKLAASDTGATAAPVLTDAEWTALKAICD